MIVIKPAGVNFVPVLPTQPEIERFRPMSASSRIALREASTA